MFFPAGLLHAPRPCRADAEEARDFTCAHATVVSVEHAIRRIARICLICCLPTQHTLPHDRKQACSVHPRSMFQSCEPFTSSPFAQWLCAAPIRSHITLLSAPSRLHASLIG